MKNKIYQWDAKEYSQSSQAQQNWARELIQKLNLTGTESILDIGCGDGKVTAELASNLTGGKIIGIDSSTEMVELAKKSFPQSKYANLSFHVGDARDLQFKNQFNIIFSNAALHWVLDHIPVITGIFKALRNSGKILLQMGGKGNAKDIINILSDNLLQSEKWGKYFDNFTFPYGFHDTESYKNWLIEAGMTPIRVELIPKTMIQAGKAGLAAWIRTTWLPYTTRIPETLRENFISEIVDEYIKRHPLNDKNEVHIEMIRLEVEAIKN